MLYETSQLEKTSTRDSSLSNLWTVCPPCYKITDCSASLDTTLSQWIVLTTRNSTRQCGWKLASRPTARRHNGVCVLFM